MKTQKLATIGLTGIASLLFLTFLIPPQFALSLPSISQGAGVTTSNSNSNAQLLHSLDLYSLYPAESRGCKLSPITQAMSPDSRLLAISSHDYERACGSGTSTVTLWDLQQQKLVLEVPKTFSYPGIQFSPDGKLLVAVTPQTRIWQLSK